MGDTPRLSRAELDLRLKDQSVQHAQSHSVTVEACGCQEATEWRFLKEVSLTLSRTEQEHA